MLPKLAIFVATSGHSGVDRYVKNLAPALVRQGVLIDILKVQKHGPYFQEQVEGLRIIEFKARSVYQSLPELIDYLKKEQPNALLSDKDRVNRTAIIAKYLSGTKTKVFVSSGTTVSIDLAHRNWLDRQLQKLSMGKLYRLANGVIIPSQEAADDFANFTGFPRSKITVLPLPLIPKAIKTKRPEHPWFQEGAAPVILAIGELSLRKDFATLLRAFVLVKNKIDCRLVILGRGKEQQNLLTLAKNLGISEYVAFLGFQKEVYNFISYAKVFAFTSRWEGFGAVIVEALACGVAVVAANCPSGPKEIIGGNEVLGDLFSVGNVPSMAELLLKRLQNFNREGIEERLKRIEEYRVDKATCLYKKLIFGEGGC
jgi:glycosyltransferase involved in cell wall biosynthesis